MLTIPTFEEVFVKIANHRDLTALDQLVRWIHTASSNAPSSALQRIYQDAMTTALQRVHHDALRGHTDKLRRELADAAGLPKDLAWHDLLDHIALLQKPKPTPPQTDDQRDAERYRKLVASGRFIPSFSNPPLTLAPSDYTYAKHELDAAVDLYQP